MRLEGSSDALVGRYASPVPVTRRSMGKRGRTGIAVALLLAACGTEDRTTVVGDEARSETLPTMQNSVDCDPQAPPVTIADLASRSEAFIVGTVVSITPIEGPWEPIDGGDRLYGCPYPAVVGVDLELTDLEEHGLDPAAGTVLRVTAHELAGWSSRPAVAGDTVTWEPEQTGHIAVGMRVGGFVATPYSGDPYISIGPLVQEVDGELMWQRAPGYDACNALPNLNGASGADIAAAVEASGALASDIDASREQTDTSYRRSGLCGEPPVRPSCVEVEPGEYVCPEGMRCDPVSMQCA